MSTKPGKDEEKRYADSARTHEPCRIVRQRQIVSAMHENDANRRDKTGAGQLRYMRMGALSRDEIERDAGQNGRDANHAKNLAFASHPIPGLRTYGSPPLRQANNCESFLNLRRAVR